MAALQNLQIDLPNFPDEVLSDWLLPYAQSEGWPPASCASAIPRGRWRYLLRNQPLAYWQSITWSKVSRHVSLGQLHPQNQEIMIHMVLGAVLGQRNLYSASIPDLKPRFERILSHLGQSGLLPRPPALLVEPAGLSVLDGNHRMAAYLYSYGYFKLDPGTELMLKTEEVQSYWVGET